jgi:Tfp pilus assembly protein PilF
MGFCLGCIHQGRFDEAIAAYNEGLSKDPKNEAAHKEKVEVESARKALAQAREFMQKVRMRARQSHHVSA